jgi:hypothetical protein
MKKILIATLLVGMMVDCKEPNVKKQSTNIVINNGGRTVEIIEIEGCEYLIFYYYRGRSITHKGNCYNPIHKAGNK